MADHDEAWLTQEIALREGREPADHLLMQALADPVLDPVPEGFAAQMAMLAAPQTDERPEMLLQYGLLGLLAVSGLAIILPDLATLQDLSNAADIAMPGWIAVLLLCLGLAAAPGFFDSRLR